LKEIFKPYYTKEANMKKETVKKLALELFDSVRKRFEKRIDTILNSGCVDISEYAEDDYSISRAITHNIFKELADDFRPLSPELQDIADNMKHF